MGRKSRLKERNYIVNLITLGENKMTTARYRGVTYNVEERHKLNALAIIKAALEKDEKLHQAALAQIMNEHKK